MPTIKPRSVLPLKPDEIRQCLTRARMLWLSSLALEKHHLNQATVNQQHLILCQVRLPGSNSQKESHSPPSIWNIPILPPFLLLKSSFRLNPMTSWLVVSNPLKHMKVSDDSSQYMENQKLMFQTSIIFPAF